MISPCKVHAMTTTSRCRNRPSINSANNKPHNRAVVAAHEPSPANAFIVADRPGPSTPIHRTTHRHRRDPHGGATQLTGEDHQRQGHQHHRCRHPSDPGALQRMRQRRWPPGRAPRRDVRSIRWGPARPRGHPPELTVRRCPCHLPTPTACRRRHCEGYELTFTLPKRLKPRTRTTAADTLAGRLPPRSLAPEQREPADSTWTPSGTSTSMLPNGATALIATWPAGTPARRKLTSRTANTATGYKRSRDGHEPRRGDVTEYVTIQRLLVASTCCNDR